MESTTMLYITGIVIAFFLASLLMGKKNRSLADNLLSVWLVLIGVHLLLYYLWFTGKIYQVPWVLGWDRPLPMVHGPFLYLYAAALINRFPPKRVRMLLHFLPIVVAWLFMFRFFLLTPEQKIYVYQHRGAGFETFSAVVSAAIIVSGISYIVLTQMLLIRHRHAILDEFSSTEKINLKWLQYLLVGIAVIWLSVIAGTDRITFVAVVLLVLFMGYFGIRQVGIFTHARQIIAPVPPAPQNSLIPDEQSAPLPDTEPPATAHAPENHHHLMLPEILVEKKKYSKSGLTREMARSLHQELTQLMQKEKLFSESELSLSDLAARLGVHPNYLSQVINEQEGKNFYDYINTLRIEAFKKLVNQPGNQRYTILSLAFECGFNSKSSFNRYFKKATGQSPSEYLQRQEAEVEPA